MYKEESNFAGEILGLKFYDSKDEPFASIKTSHPSHIQSKTTNKSQTIPKGHNIIGIRCNTSHKECEVRCNDRQQHGKVNGLRELSFVLWAPPDASQ